MSSTKTRISTFLLALLLIVTALFTIACNNEQPGEDETSTNLSSDSVSDSASESVSSLIPDDLRFDGREFSIFCTGLDNMLPTATDDVGKDVVSEAIWKRNMAVEERLGVTLNYFQDGSVNVSNITLVMTDYLMSGDTTYDLYVGSMYGMASLVTAGGFADASSLAYVNFENPWWNNRMMDEASIGADKRYFLVSDYFISSLERTHIIYFNKNVYNDFNLENPNQLYDWVEDGSWTLEKYAATAKSVYKDLNNNGVSDTNDLLGWVTEVPISPVDPFSYIADIDFAPRNEDGVVESINLLSEKANNLNEAVCNFFYQTGCVCNTGSGEPSQMFMDDETLFIVGYTLDYAVAFRDKSGVGYLPYPKFEEIQDNYNCLVADVATVGVLNNLSSNLDIAGAVLEVLSEESHKTVVPAYFETALKVKYADDGDKDAKMLDIIRESSYTSFVYFYNPVLNGIGTLMRATVSGNQASGWTAAVTQYQDAANTMLQDIVNLYLDKTEDEA